MTECQIIIERQKTMLKSLMRDMNCSTLFATYNSIYDTIDCFIGDGNCCDAFTCDCDECTGKVNSNE